MKTKILSYLDVSELVYDPEKLHLTVKEETLNDYVQKELKFLRKKHGTTIDAGADHAIEDGDIVMMKATSELPKFNRPMIPVSLGKGLFNKRVEEALLGLHLGEKKEVTIDEKPVTLEVLKVKTKTEPELNWEMIKDDVHKEYPNVDSMEAFIQAKREECIGGHKEDHYLYNVYPGLREQILDNLEIEIDQEELEAYFELIREQTVEDADSESMPYYDFVKRCFPEWADYTEEQIDEAFEEFNTSQFKMEQYLQHLYYLEHPREQHDVYKETMEKCAKETGETVESFYEREPNETFMFIESTHHTGMRMFQGYLDKVTVEVI